LAATGPVGESRKLGDRRALGSLSSHWVRYALPAASVFLAAAAIACQTTCFPTDLDQRTNLGFPVENEDETIGKFRQALRKTPDSADAHNNLGLALAEAGRRDEAIAHYRRALEIKPDFSTAHYNFGLAAKNVDEAILHYRRAIEIKPRNAKAHNNLGVTFKNSNQIEEAISQYRQALEIKPDFVESRVNLAVALASNKEFPEAIVQFQQSLDAIAHNKPSLAADVHNNLGAALKNSNRVDEAIDHFRQALAINPDYVEARFNLASALAGTGSTGKVDEAAVQFQQALDDAIAQNKLSLANDIRAQLQIIKEIIRQRKNE
jgi:tetratricopeptide (TPR) repeat protein